MTSIKYRMIGALTVGMALSACTANYEMAGKFDNANEVFRGQVKHNIAAGRSQIKARGEVTGLTCEGIGYVTYVPPLSIGCAGQRGKADLTCDDGRIIDADWQADSCTTGTGRGSDNFGNKFRYAFGLNAEEATEYVHAALPGTAQKPRLNNTLEVRRQHAVQNRKLAAESNFPLEPTPIKFPVGEIRPDDVAVIIGNANYTKYGRDIPDVTPAYADAEAFRQFAMTTLGIPETNIIYLRDATLTDLVATFGNDVNHKGQAFNWVKPGVSKLYVYYAGHGAPGTDADAGSYLVPVNAEASLINLAGYSLDTLYRNLAQVPSVSTTVVLESCFSGASQSGSVIQNASPVFVPPKDAAIPENLTVITASASDQIASWVPDKSQSLFTKFFLTGIAGAADEAKGGNGDGTTDYTELQTYLTETLSYEAKRHYGREQTAQFHNIGGNIVLSAS